VLGLLGEGKTTAEIAAELQLSMKTVHAYIWRLKKKFGIQNFYQLIRIAVLWRAGMVEIVARAANPTSGAIL